MTQKLNLSQVYTTNEVYDEMRRNDWFRYDLHAAVNRFTAKDWGECFASDMEHNETALEAGEDQIIGVYDTHAGRIWVMAEPSTMAAKILFQHEY